MSSDLIERPTFYEGQVLGAGDLQASADYPRAELARHERFLHSWGIADGLVLSAANGQVKVGAGLAIDGSGREIVVPADEPLPTANFSSVLQSDPAILYPVFLVGLDQAAAVSSSLTGLCNDAQPSRVVEGHQYQYGRPGDELSLDEQVLPDIADGPGGGSDATNVWRVLLGFVSAKDGKPDAPVDYSPSSGIGRRYAGVRADSVSARSTTLALETSDGAQGKPVLTIGETDGALLTFGLQGAAPVFSVNAKGDLVITGKFGTGTPKGSAVLVQSGVASDGVLLPLPNGVTRAMVDQKQVALHVQVSLRAATPLPPQIATAGPLDWGAFPLECFVDDDYRVHCALRWHFIGSGAVPPVATFDAPSSCNYTLFAVFPPDTR